MSDRLTQLQKLHAADPNDAELCYMIALEHSKAGDVEEALRWLDRALELEPGFHYAYFQRGKLLGALGRDTEARETIKRGLNRANADGNAKAAGELADLLASMSG